MKKLTLSMIILSAMSTSYAAKITVDNTPGSAAQYNNLQTAITSAGNGDTLLVYGSSYNYGNISVDKLLTLIGSAGFDPGVSNENTPTIGICTFTTGSSSSVISGFYGSFIDVQGTTNDLGIYNNRFSGSYGVRFYYSNSTDIVIEGNIFQSVGQYFIDNYANGSTLNNILIKNNYFEALDYYYNLGNYNNSAFTYQNNVIVSRSSSGYQLFATCSNVLFENNIFWVTVSAYVDITGQQCANCVFNNNIIYNSGGGTMTAINAIGNGVTGSNNILNIDPQFVNFTQGDNYTIAENYRLTNGSPGHLTGTDGSDIGLYGANYNWENRKYPKSFPHQEVLNVINNSVPQGTPVNINLKARKAGN